MSRSEPFRICWIAAAPDRFRFTGISRRKQRIGAGPMMVAALMIALAGCAGGARVNPPLPSPPAPPGPPIAPLAATPDLQAIRYTIQVGAFSTPARAAAYAETLTAAGIDAYYFIDSDNLFKVRFGRFDSTTSARDLAADLVARGVIDDFYIVRPRPQAAPDESLIVLQASIVDTARRFIGTPYRWGGASAGSGFDCSGLTMTVYRLNGLDLPRTAVSQFQAGAVVPKEGLQAGDLVFFRTGARRSVSHVGIYSGNGRFIHSPGSGKTIRTGSLSSTYFRQRFAGARRYLSPS